MRQSDPKKLAENFINSFHMQKVSGSEMMKWIEETLIQYGNYQKNRGIEEGRDSKSQVYSKGCQEGYDKGYREGYNKGYHDGESGL